MSFVILQDACIACGACREECPSGAIELSGAAFRIITEKCVECASCLESCPAGAIVED